MRGVRCRPKPHADHSCGRSAAYAGLVSSDGYVYVDWNDYLGPKCTLDSGAQHIYLVDCIVGEDG